MVNVQPDETEEELRELFNLLNKSGVGMSHIKDNQPQPYTIWWGELHYILHTPNHFEKVKGLDIANPVWVIDAKTKLSPESMKLMAEIWNLVSDNLK